MIEIKIQLSGAFIQFQTDTFGHSASNLFQNTYDISMLRNYWRSKYIIESFDAFLWVVKIDENIFIQKKLCDEWFHQYKICIQEQTRKNHTHGKSIYALAKYLYSKLRSRTALAVIYGWHIPDSKVWAQVSPMLTPWTLLSGMLPHWFSCECKHVFLLLNEKQNTSISWFVC